MSERQDRPDSHPQQDSDPDRRRLLKLGLGGAAAAMFSPSLGAFADPASASEGQGKKAPPREGKARAIIQIFLPGGMSAQESWDPKPLAPIEFRGDIGSIKTKLAGVRLSQLMPQTARILDKVTLIRSMTHGEAAHERGTHNMFTGSRPSPAIIFPSFGSVIAQRFGPKNNLPPYVCIPNQPNDFAGSGYLSSATAPFSLGSDPARGNFRVRDLGRPKGVDDKRFARRRAFLDLVNGAFQRSDDALAAMERFYQQAYALIDSPKARAALDLNKEPKKLRDAYGRNQAGQRLLLARRLVESGVRCVTVTYGGWDMHDRINRGMRRSLPNFDRAFAHLINDLEGRGLLDSTLVLVTSEFGRTPKLNRNGGRDHWPKVFSTVMAGGGVKRGLVYGATDATATEPDEDALGVEDWAATVYHLAGIDSRKALTAPGNRPVPIVKDGQVRRALLA